MLRLFASKCIRACHITCEGDGIVEIFDIRSSRRSASPCSLHCYKRSDVFARSVRFVGTRFSCTGRPAGMGPRGKLAYASYEDPSSEDPCSAFPEPLMYSLRVKFHAFLRSMLPLLVSVGIVLDDRHMHAQLIMTHAPWLLPVQNTDALVLKLCLQNL